MFWDTFLSVLGVIGIVAVAAFVIVFLSDLFITIVDGTNGIFFKRHKKIVHTQDTRVIKKPVLLDKPVETLMAPKEDVEEEEELDIEKATQEEEEVRRLNLQRKNLVSKRSAILPVKEQEEDDELGEDEEEEIDDEDDEIIDNTPASSNEEMIDEITNEYKKMQSQQKPAVTTESFTKDLEREKLSKEIEELKRQIAEANEIISALQKAQETPKSSAFKAKEETIEIPAGAKEELENRLEVLRTRLKDTEKELSQNRKEYIPLKRVSKTLTSDKTKLRRKEAIVAKQKVMLYGVNNYVDIDEQKAKKLSEELDLLEGLRLSVQHCEEVMTKNLDRFPILERVNDILTKNQKDLKEDIKTLEEQLKAYETATNVESDMGDETADNE